MIKAGALDLVLLWASKQISPFYLWGFWDFPQSLDEERLKQAVGRLFERIPVLGCRLDVGFWRAVWRPVADSKPDELVLHHRLSGLAEVERATAEIVDDHLDVERAVGFRLHLLDWGGGSRLVLHVHHCLADGRGFANIMEELARCYRGLNRDPHWRPETSLPTARGVRQLIRKLRLRDWLRMPLTHLLEQGVRVPLGKRMSWLRMDRETAITGRLGVARQRPFELDPTTMGRVLGWCRDHGVTLNDHLMTALAVTVHRWNLALGNPRGSHLPMVFASDLRRRFASEAGPVANLSGVHGCYLPLGGLGSFAETLPLIKHRMDQHKRQGLGLDTLFNVLQTSFWPPVLRRLSMWSVLAVMGYYLQRASGLTNIGPLSDDTGRFGDGHTAERCSILASIFPVNCVLFTGTTYRGRLTVQMGYDGRGLSDESATRFGELLGHTWEESLDDG